MKKICQKCSDTGKWYPLSVSKLESYLNKLINDNNIDNSTAIRKNIAYNLQYLEFQAQMLSEFKVSSVIMTQTWKMYIIIGTSIIEALLYVILHKNEIQKTNEWKEIKRTSSTIKLLNKPHKIENVIYEKLTEPISEQMTLDTMIKKSETKKILGDNEAIYRKLNYLRKLRNKVHLHALDEVQDTDWNSINKKEFNLIREILHIFLICSYFTPTNDEKNYFKYLTENT
jgi:hypothetical protein